MPLPTRNYTLFDKLIEGFDQTLRTLTNTGITTGRPNPATTTHDKPLTLQEQKHSAALMRINHAGEVCAQALYQGQALTAHSDQVREKMTQSAIEENDHLDWCNQRLKELNSHNSYLNPFWYFGSFAIGALAGMIGDKWSLGFVAETEHQVVKHLDKHLQKLPVSDEKSRKILQQMRTDELHHAAVAEDTGAAELPMVIRQVMRSMSRIMTTAAYWV